MADSSPPMIRVGGVDFPMKRESHCHVCLSPHRMEMERGLIAGYSYRSIIESIEGLDHQGKAVPDVESLKGHMSRGHMPLPQVSQRKAIERRAEEIGRSIETDEEPLADPSAVIDTIIQHGFERIARNELRPNTSELIGALKLRLQIDQANNADGVDQETWRAALMTMMEIFQRRLPSELWQGCLAEFAQHPVLRAMSTRTVPGEIE